MDRPIPVDERLSHAATIPSWCYTEPSTLVAERKTIFARTWQLVGREDQVAAPGSYFTAEVAGEPLLLVRGADERLRALSNVCRHRAGPVAKGEGTCGAFRCGYHGWSYGLDGRLANTPEF
ncbi:MAG: Rieske (2Fe-2S) protein, partial [Acidobacteriota bacterium]|nr:Rieske (2Fe-2S) protein [Acidobacteriota bacterium]